MFVKICGLRTEEHIAAAVAEGADALGFVFAASPRRVDPAHAAAITDKVPDTIKTVAVMLHPTNEEWQGVLHTFAPDVLQADAGDFAALDVPDDIECWPVYRQGVAVTVPRVRVTVPFLYEGAASGQGETVDWTRAAAIARRGNMILAGGLSPANVADAIATARPFGVDVSSGVEISRGEKDANLIREFIRAARAAERQT